MTVFLCQYFRNRRNAYNNSSEWTVMHTNGSEWTEWIEHFEASRLKIFHFPFPVSIFWLKSLNGYCSFLCLPFVKRSHGTNRNCVKSCWKISSVVLGFVAIHNAFTNIHMYFLFGIHELTRRIWIEIYIFDVRISCLYLSLKQNKEWTTKTWSMWIITLKEHDEYRDESRLNKRHWGR